MDAYGIAALVAFERTQASHGLRGHAWLHGGLEIITALHDDVGTNALVRRAHGGTFFGRALAVVAHGRSGLRRGLQDLDGYRPSRRGNGGHGGRRGSRGRTAEIFAAGTGDATSAQRTRDE